MPFSSFSAPRPKTCVAPKLLLLPLVLPVPLPPEIGNSVILVGEQLVMEPVDWRSYEADDNNYLHPASFFDELVSFLDEEALAAAFALIPAPEEEESPWTSLPPHEEEDVGAFLLPQDVSDGSVSDGSGSPQYSDDPQTFGAAGSPLNPPPEGYSVPYGAPSDERHGLWSAESSPTMRIQFTGEGEFSDDGSSQLMQGGDARADSAPQYKDYMQIDGSSPEDDHDASSREETGGADVNAAAARTGDDQVSGSPLPPTWLTLGPNGHHGSSSAPAAPSPPTSPVAEASPPHGSLTVALMKHQRIALSWMIQREASRRPCTGGILADDQGLGKTLSTIALIVSERPLWHTARSSEEEDVVDDDDDDWFSLGLKSRKMSSTSSAADRAVLGAGRPAGGTLVVCPTSVLRQWEDELQNKVTSSGKLKVLVYYGPGRTRDPKELARHDVVLTTYHIVSMESPKEPVGDGHGDGNVSSDGYDTPPGVDDAYSSAGRKRKKKSSAGTVKSGTATDHAGSAWPLATVSWFRVVLDEAQTIKNHKTRAARACSGLRAKRRWCLSGTPIQNSVKDLYSYFRFLRHGDYSDYASFRDLIKHIEHDPDGGYRNLQVLLKAILLRRTKETQIDGQTIVDLPPKSVELKALDFSAEERAFYNDLESQSREQFMEYQDAGTVRQNYVNILQLLLRLRQACNHAALVRTASTSAPYVSPPPTTRAAAKELGRDKCLDLLRCLAASHAICAVCSDPPEDAVVSACGHVFCNQCVSDHLSTDDIEAKACPKTNCKRRLNAATLFTRASLESCISDAQAQLGPGTSAAELLAPANQAEQKEAVLPADSSKIKAAAELLPANQSEQKEPVVPVDSSKIKAAMEVLSSLPNLEHSSSSVPPAAARQATEKALVFSQWTKMLDLLENELGAAGIPYKRLDGTMPIADRDRAVKEFNTSPALTVMLMSLKAASVGLNMVAANHVLLLDPWWNPTTEDQAIDRAHRIGQTRAVKVTRFTVKDTVEDRIMNLQAKKRRTVDSAFGEVTKGSQQSPLTVEDLSYLFKA